MDNKKDLRKKVKKLPRLTRLFDRWMPEALTMLGALKFLQFLRLLGVKARANGWRKVTSIFLRSENSKFILGCFRLNPDALALLPPPDFKIASERLAAKLAAYLRRSNAISYWVEPEKAVFVRRKKKFRDLVLAEVDEVGNVIRLRPFFDGSAPALEAPGEELDEVLKIIIYYANKLRNMPEPQRAVKLLKKMRRWSQLKSGFNYFGRRRLMYISRRIIHATVLFISQMKSLDEINLTNERFEMPDFRKKYRNPGLGMLNVAARFTPDCSEVDLWCQFNHVAVDGLPMQEFLNQLKKEWGEIGAVKYPACSKSIFNGAQIRYADERKFRALCFVDFKPLLIVRKYLNEHYKDAMGGEASVAGLIMWGLTRHKSYVRQKILLPVDAGVNDGERNLGFVIIRPRQNMGQGQHIIEDFCKFQKELHRRMELARSGNGAVTEFLALCTMMRPFGYRLARYIWPQGLDEALGTVGLSILRDAEVFISPLTEFQSGGFIAVGNLAVPTIDGGTAAAVSVAGTRRQVADCLSAVADLPRDMVRMFDLPDGWGEAGQDSGTAS